MDDLDQLAGILDKTRGLIAGTRREQWVQQTPCPDFDVRSLLTHILGWVRVFDAGANGGKFDGDPTAYEVGDGAADDFAAHAASLVEGFRAGGTDRTISLVGGDMPAPMVLSMAFMEYMTHGCDLATATGQDVSFTDAEAEATLERAQQTLQPEYRGDQIGPPVDVPADAPAIDRFIGFMGRTPR